MKTKKIIKALKTISKVCKKMKHCSKCPFRKEYYGYINCELDMTLPKNWDIKYIEEQLKDIERL